MTSLKQSVKRHGGRFGRRLVGAHRLARAGRIISDLGLDLADNDMRYNGESEVQRFALENGYADVVVDVGANLGLWSAQLLAKADEVGQQPSQMLLVEADIDTFGELQRSVAGWATTSQLSLAQVAVSDFVGEATFRSFGSGEGTNSLIRSTGAGEEREPIERQVEVIDPIGLAQRYGLQRMGLVKIDTEGNDLAVLRGLRPFMAEGRVDLIQFEYNHRWIGARSFLKDVFDLVPTDWFIGRLCNDGIRGIARWEPELETFREANYLVASPEAAKRLQQSPWLVDKRARC